MLACGRSTLDHHAPRRTNNGSNRRRGAPGPHMRCGAARTIISRRALRTSGARRRAGPGVLNGRGGLLGGMLLATARKAPRSRRPSAAAPCDSAHVHPKEHPAERLGVAAVAEGGRAAEGDEDTAAAKAAAAEAAAARGADVDAEARERDGGRGDGGADGGDDGEHGGLQVRERQRRRRTKDAASDVDSGGCGDGGDGGGGGGGGGDGGLRSRSWCRRARVERRAGGRRCERRRRRIGAAEARRDDGAVGRRWRRRWRW